MAAKNKTKQIEISAAVGQNPTDSSWWRHRNALGAVLQDCGALCARGCLLGGRAAAVM